MWFLCSIFFRWFGRCWHVQDLRTYEFELEFDVSTKQTDKNGCRCGIVIVGINKIISSINNAIYAQAGNLIKGIAIC